MPLKRLPVIGETVQYDVTGDRHKVVQLHGGIVVTDEVLTHTVDPRDRQYRQFARLREKGIRSYTYNNRFIGQFGDRTFNLMHSIVEPDGDMT